MAASVIAMFALIPGLPKIPFLVIGGLFGAIAWAVRDGLPDEEKEEVAGVLTAGDAQAALPSPNEEAVGKLSVDPLELPIGFGLVPLVDGNSNGALLRRVSMIRRQIAGELGIVIPPVRIHDELGLDSHEYRIKVRGSEVARGRIMPGHLLALDPGDAAPGLQGIPRPSRRSACPPCGSPSPRAPRPRRSVTRSSTCSR